MGAVVCGAPKYIPKQVLERVPDEVSERVRGCLEQEAEKPEF
jgi:hypothetical protein